MATIDTLRRLVPAMATVSDSACNEWLADASAELPTEPWPTDIWPRAVCYLAGHSYLRSLAAAMAGTGSGGSGAVTSESAGGMSRGYGSFSGSTSASGDAYYETTPAGVEFLRLRRTHCVVEGTIEVDTTYALRDG